MPWRYWRGEQLFENPYHSYVDTQQPHIIVDGSGRPCITEFGVFSVFEDPLPSQMFRCERWSDPVPGGTGGEVDVFSFAMVMVEVTLRHWT